MLIMTEAVNTPLHATCIFRDPNGKCRHIKQVRRWWSPLYWLGYYFPVCSELAPHWIPDNVKWRTRPCPLRQAAFGKAPKF